MLTEKWYIATGSRYLMTLSQSPSSTKYQERNSPLGNTVNNSAANTVLGVEDVQVSPANNRSVSRYSMLKHAQDVLNTHNVLSARTGNAHATRRCMHYAAYEQAPHITLNSNAKASRAGISGVQTCNSQCACPVCVQRIMIQKGEDILRALQWGENNGCIPIMITLTARHHAGMRLAQFRADFQRAWSHFNGSRKWKKLKKAMGVKHAIYGREVTYGKHGWHYHMHVVLFVPKSVVLMAKNEAASVAEMREYWVKCLRSKGLDGLGEHALKATGVSDNKAYLAKFGLKRKEQGKLEYEMTNGADKDSQTVWDLLEDSYWGDIEARMLYVEFVEAMNNHQIITFSNGFRDLFEDVEIEENAIPENQVLHRWLEISPREWTAIIKLGRIPNIVEAAAKYRCREKLKLLLQRYHDEWWYAPREEP